MTCRLWVIFVCLNGVAASPQNYTHPKVVAVRDVLVVVGAAVLVEVDSAEVNRLSTVSIP